MPRLPLRLNLYRLRHLRLDDLHMLLDQAVREVLVDEDEVEIAAEVHEAEDEVVLDAK